MDGTTLDIADETQGSVFLAESHRAWGPTVSYEGFAASEHAIAALPWLRSQSCTLILREASGTPVSSLQLLALRALVENREVWLGGLRRIVTPEPLRRRGYASALLRMTCDLLRRERISGVYLFSDADPSSSRHRGFEGAEVLGFESLEIPVIEAPLALLPSLPPDAGVSVRPMAPSDATAVANLHRRAAEGAPFWLLRDEEQWRALRAMASQRLALRSGGEVRLCDLILEDGSEIAGYLLAQMCKEVCEILEFALARHDPAGLGSLLAGLRQQASTQGVTQVAALWPPGRCGDLAARFFQPGPQRDVLLLASFDARLVPERITRHSPGFWLTDRI